MIKHYDHKQLGYFAYTSMPESIIKGNQNRNSNQETWGRNWCKGKSTSYCLLMTYSALLLTESWTSSLWVVVSIVVWVLLYKSSTKKYTIAFPTGQPIGAHLPKCLYLVSSWHKTSNAHTHRHTCTHIHMRTHTYTYPCLNVSMESKSWCWVSSLIHLFIRQDLLLY